MDKLLTPRCVLCTAARPDMTGLTIISVKPCVLGPVEGLRKKYKYEKTFKIARI